MLCPEPIVVDLFCGVGGLSLGAVRAGFSVKGAVDSDTHAVTAHAKNFPMAVHLQADVSSLTGSRIRSSFGIEKHTDFGMIGGPPCQGFSNMGRRNRNDLRNHLFVDFFRVVQEAQPSFYLVENVPGIMRDDYSAIRDEAFSHLPSDYVVLPPVWASGNSYGAPTSRLRVFFFGYLPDRLGKLTEESFLPQETGNEIRVREALRGLPSFVDPLWQKEEDGWRVCSVRSEGFYASRLQGHIPPNVGNSVALHRLADERKASGNLGTLHSPEVKRRYGRLDPGKSDPISKSQRLDPDGFCPTLRSGTGPELGSFQAVRPIHPSEPRVITPREAARLQGFPDWFTFSPSKWHSFRQIGGSVSPLVAEQLMSTIRRSIDH